MVLSATLAAVSSFSAALTLVSLSALVFSWVLFPFRHLAVLLQFQGQPHFQNSLSCTFQISPVSLLLHEPVEGHQVLHILIIPVHSLAENSLLAFSFWSLHINSFPSSHHK